MKVNEAITMIDDLKPNNYTLDTKVKWLSDLDSAIYKEIILKHEGSEDVVFDGYGNNNITSELIAPAPFEEMYLDWLESKIDYYNGEMTKYNNSITRYNDAYTQYARWYNRNHVPITSEHKYW